MPFPGRANDDGNKLVMLTTRRLVSVSSACLAHLAACVDSHMATDAACCHMWTRALQQRDGAQLRDEE
jgi:hypothetical protein